MYADINELFLYRNFEDQSLFENFAGIINHYESINYEEIKKNIYQCANELVEFGVRYGFEGNLWHGFLTYSLVNNENSFSKSLEIEGSAGGTISQLAINDFSLFKRLYDFDLSLIDKVLGIKCLCFISDFVNSDSSKAIIDQQTVWALKELTGLLGSASDSQEFYNQISSFYRQFGVGKFAIYRAFKVISGGPSSGQPADIAPITNTEPITLEDLVGYELQKKELIKNTEDFINGHRANNVLLYGDSGTGKSTSIKAILNRYSSRGLRMIEVYKHQFGHLQEIIQQVKDRNYKFIIYMDDLSFEEYETEYKYLKAIIEGGLEIHPQNVLLYATSNRRHLIREKWSDKADRDDDLHTNDTVQEKLSLAARFGLSILYISPNKKEFNNIVNVLARKNSISLPEDQLLLEANRWEMRHGGLSGRTAQHFITYLKTKV
ncbi:replication factor C large subunit [Ruminiclostridium hungatei]|uniref:Replication factor C large subunit n=1 Tax=Ruminiclostridium hungatei TaxID=48256 RepID=A0A1V4SIA4_RUMHU|nr:ATP-binding protein [Ruminiclostridium hungatei]OPX43618.1 replication factor C large subunit [Ruminiclostridium hungatei]